MQFGSTNWCLFTSPSLSRCIEVKTFLNFLRMDWPDLKAEKQSGWTIFEEECRMVWYFHSDGRSATLNEWSSTTGACHTCMFRSLKCAHPQHFTVKAALLESIQWIHSALNFRSNMLSRNSTPEAVDLHPVVIVTRRAANEEKTSRTALVSSLRCCSLAQGSGPERWKLRKDFSFNFVESDCAQQILRDCLVLLEWIEFLWQLWSQCQAENLCTSDSQKEKTTVHPSAPGMSDELRACALD